MVLKAARSPRTMELEQKKQKEYISIVYHEKSKERDIINLLEID